MGGNVVKEKRIACLERRSSHGKIQIIRDLPLSEALTDFLNDTGILHDRSLNWDYPPDPPDQKDWTPEMEAEFERRAQEGYDRICAGLGENYEIEYAV